MRLLLASFLFVRFGQAQEADGYSVIDYDASTGLIIGYSETDLDDAAQAYYQARVSATLVDQNGQTLSAGLATDTQGANGGEIGTTVAATAQPNMTYTIHGHHSGIADYSIEADNGGLNWFDAYEYTMFGNPDSETYLGEVSGLIGPGYYAPTKVINIVSTDDSASLTTSTSCGDDRDYLLDEYTNYHIPGINLTCASFTTGHSTPYFSASSLLKSCPSHPNQEYS